MAIRKAGEVPELLNAALRGRRYSVVNPADLNDLSPLEARLASERSALLAPGDLRAVLTMAESPRKTAQMTPQQRLEVVQRYLEGVGAGAPMLFPVTRGHGAEMQTLGASLIDGDHLVSHALQNGADDGGQLLFVPGASSAPITHVVEREPVPEGGSVYYGTMPTEKARTLYKQALRQGYQRAKSDDVLEEFLWDGKDVINAPGPTVMELYRGVRGAPQPAYRMPMYFAYGNNAIAETAPTTFDAILQGQRTSTLRKPGEIPAGVQPGSLIEVYDRRDPMDPATRKQLVEVVGRRMVDASMAPELSMTERWTPEFLANYINRVGGGQLEQILYRLPG